jgi:glutathione synthase/RimK-type ligase-like ATP-grasp enzyme
VKTLFIAKSQQDWDIGVPDIMVISPHAYLANPVYRHVSRIVNLCDSYSYQGTGYYVSLLAEARDHHPLPTAKTIEDLQSQTLVDRLTADLDGLIQSSLHQVISNDTTNANTNIYAMDIYFGMVPEGQPAPLARQLFNRLPAPILRAIFTREDWLRNRHWRLSTLQTMTLNAIPQQDREIFLQAAAAYQSRPLPAGESMPAKYGTGRKPALAILHDVNAQVPPSDPGAIENFIQAAKAAGMDAEIITQVDRQRLMQFDALFIRDTTHVKHYTYQFARQAALMGLAVIDDPDAILKCSNKVYLTELFNCHDIPIPRTLMVNRHNLDSIIPALGLPCILKQPDGAFSMGVSKVTSKEELRTTAALFFQQSALLLAQEYLPTEFDWRIGVLDNRALFACKYFMAPGHWQIVHHQDDSKLNMGHVEAVPLDEVPPEVLKTALDATNLIGTGFYGVDLKHHNQQCAVIEINDNPNVDAGNEDAVAGMTLYSDLIHALLTRIDHMHSPLLLQKRYAP